MLRLSFDIERESFRINDSAFWIGDDKKSHKASNNDKESV